MEILLIMCVGIFIGKKFVPYTFKKSLEYLQLVCISLLIFSLGASMGSRENFLDELKILGFDSLIFFLIPTLCSILAVYFFTRKTSKKGKESL